MARHRSISCSRGFSIVEVLIALSIVVAIGALAMPNLVGMSKTVRMKEAGRIVEDAVAEARTEAQRRGVAIRLHAETTPDGRTVLVGKAASVRDVVNQRLQGEGEASETGHAAPGASRFGQALVWAQLPEGCSLDTEATDGIEDANTTPNNTWEPTDEQRANLPKWLWVVLPDGAVSSERASTLKGPGERRASVVVNRWTGSVRVRELASSNTSPASNTTKVEPTTTTDAQPAATDEETGG
jgi:Tfp pilus assembly protein FimT